METQMVCEAPPRHIGYDRKGTAIPPRNPRQVRRSGWPGALKPHRNHGQNAQGPLWSQYT